MIPHKWKYDEARRLISATEKVTNQDVEDIVDWIVEQNKSIVYSIFSGVHGLPGGLIQIDDPEFYKHDREMAQPGSGKKYDPKIEVFKMPFRQTVPPQLAEKLCDVNATVILAWCYSDGFVDTGAAGNQASTSTPVPGSPPRFGGIAIVKNTPM